MINIYPSKEEIKNLIKNPSDKYIIPIWCEVIADLETPVSAYHKTCKDKKYSFLLESVERGESCGRYSFIGMDTLYVLRSDQEEAVVFSVLDNDIIMKKDNPYDLLKEFFSKYSAISCDLPYCAGAVGYLGYDSVRHIEPGLNKIFKNIEECSSFPESYFMVAGTVLVFDHVKHKIYVIKNVLIDETTDIDQIYQNSKENIELILSQLSSSHNLSPLMLNLNPKEAVDISSNISKQEWIKAVNKAKEHIKAGDIFQVVLSQRFCVEKDDLETFTIYRALRSINPSPYLYYLNFDSFQIIGSSPEIMVKCSNNGIAQLRPIAGTKKRGLTPDMDLALEQELLNDPKERAEHIMLVDLGRNDLGKVCEYGSVKVQNLMEVEKYSHVQHIVTNVTGKLKQNLSSIDLVKACFPAGTVSGAPKVRAMEIIADLEKSARGPYAGCIGYLGFNNEVNTAITIRTMLVRDNKIFIQAGAGIVADSDPELEYIETQNKAAALIQALAQIKKHHDL
ncbi:MAG: anthranilate synthase component I [bacterium]